MQERLSVDDLNDYIKIIEPLVSDHKQKIIKNILKNRTNHLSLVVEDIYQPHNVSAVIRSCEALGINNLYTIENKNKLNINKGIEMGASKWININRLKLDDNFSYKKILSGLKDKGYSLVTTHLNKKSISIDKINLSKKIALFIGSEELGLSDNVVGDQNVTIENYGFTQSFNLSVAAALLLYEIRKKIIKNVKNWQLTKKEQLELKLKWYTQIVPHGEAVLKRHQLKLNAKNNI